MLMMFGPIKFEVLPLTMSGWDRTFGGDFAEKQVVGTRPPREFVGKSPETMNIAARIYPHQFGGADSVAKLQAIVELGQPQYLIRGDGALFGWYELDRVTESHSFLVSNGTGRVVDLDLQLTRGKAPSAVSYYQALVGLFGG